MLTFWNGFHPIWKEASNKETNPKDWGACNVCKITDDREAICLPDMNRWLTDPSEVTTFVLDCNNNMQSDSYKHGRLLAWRIPEKYRKFFCRIESGHIIPIIWMYLLVKNKSKDEWLTDCIYSNLYKNDSIIFELSKVKKKKTIWWFFNNF